MCLSLLLEHEFKAQGGSSSVGLQQLGAMVIETKKWGSVAGQLQWGERILQQIALVKLAGRIGVRIEERALELS